MMCSGCVATETPFLKDALGDGKWKVNTSDPGKILTVEGEAGLEKIIKAVEKSGFKAQSYSSEFEMT